MALTATANEECKADIKQRLHIEKCLMITSSFNRSNLHYRVIRRGKAPPIEQIANKIRASYPEQTGVIYCLSRKTCEDVAQSLRNDYDLKAYHFHAQMSVEEKKMVQDAWYKGQIHVIVATVSFILISSPCIDNFGRLLSVWVSIRQMVCLIMGYKTITGLI